MKVKGKSALGLKTVGLVSAITYALLLVIRIYQTFAITDGATGFFTSENITVPLMYILSIGSVVAVCAMCYICSRLPSGEINGKPSLFYVVAGLFFALTLAYDSVFDLNVIRAAGSIGAAKETLGGTIGVLSAFFALGGAVVILASVFLTGKGKNAQAVLRIPMLIPVLWAFCETLSFFSVTVSYVKVPQLLLTIFFVAFLMIFLFENARVVSGIGKTEAMWFFYASGITAAGLGICCAVPSLAASVISPEKIISYCPFEPYQLGGALYAIAVMIIRTRKTVKNNTDGDEKETVVTETL